MGKVELIIEYIVGNWKIIHLIYSSTNYWNSRFSKFIMIKFRSHSHRVIIISHSLNSLSYKMFYTKSVQYWSQEIKNCCSLCKLTGISAALLLSYLSNCWVIHCFFFNPVFQMLHQMTLRCFFPLVNKGPQYLWDANSVFSSVHAKYPLILISSFDS